MTDFPSESGDKEEMATVIKNIGRPQVSSGTISSQVIPYTLNHPSRTFQSGYLFV